MTAFQTVTVALILGVGSYALAKWLRIPAILFYLVCGLLSGPVGLKILRVESLGPGLVTLVEIGVAIILFEGGLSLSARAFRTEWSSINRMIVVTIPLTGSGAAVLAHYLLGMNWKTALFFGALIVVTGPTVIGSILKTVYLNRRLETLLHWESIWGDVVGVLLSALALELIIPAGDGSLRHLGFILFLRILGGGLTGVVSGYLLGRVVLPRVVRLMEPGLPGLVAVAGALGIFFGANTLLEASGPLAVAVAGFFLSHLKAEGLRDIRHFKEQLSILFISTLFVLLSASIDPLELAHRWPMMLLVALLLGAVVRPVSVFIALQGTGIPTAEKAYAALIGPRGIIALATASYAAFVLRGQESETAVVVNLTFAIIFLSGAIATLISRPLARMLKVMVRDSGLGILVVGMNPLSTALADFVSRYVPVAFADTSRDKCSLAEGMGLETVCADVLDGDLYEEAMELGYERLIAVTKDDALNQLICQAAAGHMGSQKVFRVQALPTEDAVVTGSRFSVGVAFSKDFFVERALEMLEKEEARLEVLDGRAAASLGAVPLLELTDGGSGIWIIRAGGSVRGKALCFVPGQGGK